jgi:hypothetical protein
MARKVKEQTRGCFGCAVFLFLLLVGGIFFHRYVWRKRDAPLEVRIANQRMSMINRDYYQFQEEQGRYPESFEELQGALGKGKIAYSDPWGSPFRMMDRAGTMYLYSIGPDLSDDDMSVKYDPTNGVESAGDVWMILRRGGS